MIQGATKADIGRILVAGVTIGVILGGYLGPLPTIPTILMMISATCLLARGLHYV